jgi:hypothetical protein
MEELDMQFKKLAAITGSALMAGLSLAAPVLATSVTSLKNIGSLVGVADSTVNFPIFVIGATAATSDVAGAVNMAVNLASNAVKTSTVTTSGTSTSITGGVSMATPANPLVMWNYLASSKQVLTATDLSDVLASGTYVDANSVSSPYSQYLTFTNAAANGQVVYETPTGGTAPALGLKITGTSQVYNYLLAFTKQLSEASTTAGVISNMVNTQLNMLGKTWTITSASVIGANDTALTMLSGKNSQTVTTEAPATYTVGDKTYTVTLVAVGTIGSSDAATITVSGGNLAAAETLQILSGGTKSLSDGTLIGVTSIFKTTKTGAIDSATVFIGADKLELEDTNMVDTSYYAGIKINGASITDATVRMTGSTGAGTSAAAGTTTLNSIEIQWIPSLEQFKLVGQSLTDPVSGGFSIFFGGITPALDDTTNRETITITPSGTTAGLSFKDASGNSLNQNFVKSSAIGVTNVALTDAGGYLLHLVEGEAVAQNEYVVLGQNSLAGSAQNPFGHILRVLTIQNVSTSTSQFQDVASGTTLTVTGGNTTMYLDGQAYKVCLKATTANVYFTWGTGATACYVGTSNEVDVYPTIQTSKGAWVSLTYPVNVTTAVSTSYKLNLPTGSVVVTTGDGSSFGNASNTSTVLGTALYNISMPIAGTSIKINATDNANTTMYLTPGVLITEGLDENVARNVISVRLAGDASYNRVDIATTPTFTGTKTSNSGISGTTQNKYVDQFGSFVTYDSTNPGTFSLSYPSSQAQATVGVGKSPAASTTGTGGTVTTQTVLPITSDIVRLDSEVTDADKTGKDLILVGGPCINTLVASLATANKFPYTCANWPGRNFGRVQLIADAFATGKTALVIAGTRADETDLAAQMVQQGFPGASDTIKNGLVTEVTGSVTTPAYS